MVAPVPLGTPRVLPEPSPRRGGPPGSYALRYPGVAGGACAAGGKIPRSLAPRFVTGGAAPAAPRMPCRCASIGASREVASRISVGRAKVEVQVGNALEPASRTTPGRASPEYPHPVDNLGERCRRVGATYGDDWDGLDGYPERWAKARCSRGGVPWPNGCAAGRTRRVAYDFLSFGRAVRH